MWAVLILVFSVLFTTAATAAELSIQDMQFGLGPMVTPPQSFRPAKEKSSSHLGDNLWIFNLGKAKNSDDCSFRPSRNGFTTTCPLRRGR